MTSTKTRSNVSVVCVLALAVAGLPACSDNTVVDVPDTGPIVDTGPRPDGAVPDTGPRDGGAHDTNSPDTNSDAFVDVDAFVGDGGSDAGPMPCGNGVVDVGETCDTGIASGAGACPTTCDDAVACTTDAMTGSMCTAACTHTPITAPSGTTVDMCCPTGATNATDTDCLASCGNGVVDTGETCDTGIASGAGSCPTAASCNDGMACTTDALVSGATCSAMCTHTAITAPSGTTADTCCPAGANHNTDTDCAAVCGNSVVEGPGETCDPPAAGTCDATCHTIASAGPTAFRVTTARVVSPHAVYNIPFGPGCRDLTDMGVTVLGMNINSLNGGLQSSLDDYSLNIVDVFRPLSQSAATSMDQIYVNAACNMAAMSCAPAATMSMSVSPTATNHATGTCFMAAAADVQPHCAGAGTCTAGYAAVNMIAGPCFDNAESNITVTLSVAGNAVAVPLHHARVDATYVGSPATSLTPGVIVGFLSAVDAADTVVTLPVLGARRLFNFLQAGGATQRATDGSMQASSCNLNGGAVEDDRDTVGGVSGFWFFLNVSLGHVTWTGP